MVKENLETDHLTSCGSLDRIGMQPTLPYRTIQHAVSNHPTFEVTPLYRFLSWFYPDHGVTI